MKIKLARHFGFCFGVRDAIALARKTALETPVTILGELVHNPAVLDSLARAGIPTARRLEEVKTAAVLITAHGASESAVSGLKAAGLDVRQATCPLVRFAHRSVQRLQREGYHPVIIGLRDHVEVKGLTEDLCEFDVVLTEAEIDAIPPRPRFGVASQTTQPVARVRRLVERLQTRFPGSEVRWIDTVCQPTKDRQNAAVELAAECDVVVVVGGKASNNTRELAASIRQTCPRVHQVENAEELQEDWFYSGDVAGLTAGTSTPDAEIEAVERRLRAFAARFEPECAEVLAS